VQKKIKKKKKALGYKIVVNLLFLFSIIFIISLMCLNILSMKYFIIGVILILFIDFLMWLFVMKSKISKIFCIISLIFILLFGFGSFYLFRTSSFLGNLFGEYDIYTYKLIVSNDSEIENINDLDEEVIGYVKNFDMDEGFVIDELASEIEFSHHSYMDVSLMFEDLDDGDISAVLILDSYLDLLGTDMIIDKDEFREIYSFEVKVEISKMQTNVDVVSEPFHIFVSGIDTYGEISSVSRSDVNMVVSVNPVSKKILLTSIPRDYYVSLHGISGYKDKITHAGLYGIDVSVGTVSDLLGIDINYYVKVNFTSVIDIVEALEGVEVYSEHAFTSIDGYKFKKGYNNVDGEKALSFARERQAFAIGDRQRVKNQQELLRAILKKCFSSEIIYKYSKLLDSLEGSFVTNVPTSKISDFIKMQIDDMSNFEIISNSLSGSDSYNYTYTVSSNKLYVMEVDLDSVQQAHDLIIKLSDGEDIE